MSSKISSATGPMRLHATRPWSKRALSPALLETVFGDYSAGGFSGSEGAALPCFGRSH
jgi:hypothetical protein